MEVVVPSDSFLAGESLADATFRQQFDATVLAVRTRGKLVKSGLDALSIQAGDTLLVQAPPESVDRLAATGEFIVAHEVPDPDYRSRKATLAVAIVGGVVLLPALGLLDIVASALAGVVAMAVTGVLRPAELSDSVDWQVVFLLAGVIPLGRAVEGTGAAALIGSLVASSSDVLPVLGVLWLFYVVTGVVTSVISNNASVVLMLPVAVETAQTVGAEPFSFVLAVTFAASTAFLSPVGYQTNLFVYGPG